MRSRVSWWFPEALARDARHAMPPLYPWTEYLRPWKLFTLAAGIALLVSAADLAEEATGVRR